MNLANTDNISFQIDEFYLDLQQNGSRLRNLSEEEIKKNPFPGLRPFKTSEQDLFYGRKEQINELVLKLAATNFLAVIGSSGTGKSSLVRAGLIPALFGGNIIYKGSDWKIAICRPGNDPIKNLSIALSSTKTGSSDKEKILEANNEIEPLLRASSYGILDVKELIDQEYPKSTQQNLLVIIDQFEELFRFDRKELKTQNILYQNIESDFVKLLLQCKSDIKSVFVVITMRSEFLGDCVKFRLLPEAINRSQYLVPQLEREQLRKVITGPVQRAGKEISSDLVEILINEIESEKLKENLDQLPILQHALMRTYDEAFKKNTANKEMLYEHYEETGGMKEALARHAQEVFNKLGDTVETSAIKKNYVNNLSRKQLIAKTVFQALTDAASDQKGGRRPTELQNIYDILTNDAINASHAEVDEVVNCFRDEETSFIMPPSNTKLHSGLMLDIAHESLMRNWNDLKDYWIKEETTAADLYKRLNDNREQYERDHETFIGGILLKDLLQWKNSNLYNVAWAERYQKIPSDINDNIITEKNQTNKDVKHELFLKNLDYLQKCKQRSIQEIEEDVKRNKEKLRKNRLIAALSLLVAITAISLGVYASIQGKKLNSEKLKTANAESQRKIDSANALAEAQRKIDSAESLRKIDSANTLAEVQRRIDLANAQAEAQRKIDLANLQASTALAAAKADSATNAANSVFNRLHEILELVNEPFYKSDFFNADKKNMYVDSLVKLRYRFHDTTAFNNLLNGINGESYVYDIAQKNPNTALLKAIKLNNSSKINLKDSLPYYIANNYAFCSRRITFPKSYIDYYNPRPIISKNKKFLAAVVKDSINIYKNVNDSLSLIKTVLIQRSKPDNDDYYESSSNGPGTMMFTDKNKLIVFNNNKVYKINVDDSSETVAQIPNFSQKTYNERYYTSSISPDGKKLAIDYRNYSVKVWNIDSLGISPKIINLDSIYGYINNIKFSFDGSKIIVQQGSLLNGLYTIKSLQNDSSQYFKRIDVSSDNKYVIQQTRSVFQLLNIDSLHKGAISTFNFTDINIDTFNNANAISIRLSPDWKTLVVTSLTDKNYTYNYNTYYFRRNDKDSIFKLTRELSPKNSIGRLLIMPYITDQNFFVNTDNIVSFKQGYDEDTLSFWKKFDTVANAHDLNLLVNAVSRVTDTIEDMDYELNVDTINDEEYLKKVLINARARDSRLLTKESLFNLKNVYRRLAELDTDNYLNFYRTISRNYFTYYTDTLNRIKDLKEITGIEELLFKKQASDSLKIDLSSDYWNLSWYLLLTNQLDSVVYMTQRGIQLNPVNNGINTNLALGYLLTDKCEQADSVYKTFKGATYKTDNRKFTDSFLQDLQDLEDRGVITEDKKSIYNHVQKVRKYLRGESNSLDCDK